MPKIVIDAGHGGADPGAVYNGRREKDDTLRLAMAVGEILEKRGYDVIYTRSDDTYETPFQKATEGNQANADFFVSIHRNSSEEPNQYSGVETLVFDDSGTKAQIAENINERLARLGFRNLGVKERPGLVVLRRTRMPALLVEVGFINNEEDNRLFDERFSQIAQAIADGIIQTAEGSAQDVQTSQRTASETTPRMTTGTETGTTPRTSTGTEAGMTPGTSTGTENRMTPEMTPGTSTGTETGTTPGTSTGTEAESEEAPLVYHVQAGYFRTPEYAGELEYQLQMQGFPAWTEQDEEGNYRVKVGSFAKMENAVRMEEVLRRAGYNTFITR